MVVSAQAPGFASGAYHGRSEISSLSNLSTTSAAANVTFTQFELPPVQQGQPHGVGAAQGGLGAGLLSRPRTTPHSMRSVSPRRKSRSRGGTPSLPCRLSSAWFKRRILPGASPFAGATGIDLPGGQPAGVATAARFPAGTRRPGSRVGHLKPLSRGEGSFLAMSDMSI